MMSLSPLLAASRQPWPDAVDRAALVLVLAVGLGVPLLGYLLMAVDVRRYLRSLRRALVLVQHVVPTTPYWLHRNQPPCLEALGLEFPCTEADVMEAYRREVKRLHPDRGGNLEQFLRLQKHFEQALHLVRCRCR